LDTCQLDQALGTTVGLEGMGHKVAEALATVAVAMEGSQQDLLTFNQEATIILIATTVTKAIEAMP
jgi:hypothetical protein